ncbi:ROK family protein [Microlunatus ginsengisoli]|uniref:ROK family protein n=2 Tax=Microlunatus ginsengisoli TaxID=363863 RepID=A0ABP6ZH87_9ACTN
MRYVRDNGSSSRHDIAQGCGLGISTMTDLISELRSRRLVKELDPIRRPAAGRPTRPIALDGEPWCALGIHIDVDQVRFSAVTVGGREVWSASIPVDLRSSAAEGPGIIRDILVREMAQLPPDKELLAVEVGVTGYVTRDTGTVSWSARLGWQDYSLISLVNDVLAELDIRRIHVGIANDCHLAGLHAARVELPSTPHTVAAYLGGMRGLGSSVVIAGEIYRGAHGGAGDFGHANVDPSGPACWCGRHGCLESYVGLPRLLADGGLMSLADAEQQVDADPDRAVQLLADAAAGGDADVLRVLDRSAEILGRVLDDVIGLVNPHEVILGGYLGVLSPYLLAGIRQRTEVRTAVAVFSETEIVGLTEVVPRVVRGAALAARDACLNDPLGLTRPLG